MTTTVDMVVSQLDPHQKQISEHEADSIVARWEFGRVLRAHIPEGKKNLPGGLRAEITNHYKLNPSEITARMKLAEKFTTPKQVADVCASCGGSWRRIIAEKLPKAPRKEKPGKPWNEHLEDHLRRVMDTPSRRKALAEMLRATLAKLEADIATDARADVNEAKA